MTINFFFWLVNSLRQEVKRTGKLEKFMCILIGERIKILMIEKKEKMSENWKAKYNNNRAI